MTEVGLVRTKISSKLRGSLRRRSVQTLPKTGTVRTKATVTLELSLLSKFGKITMPELGRGATVGGNPE